MLLAVPWFWLLLFFAVPFFILLRISVTDMGEGLDPFAPLAEIRDGHLLLHLKLANYLTLCKTLTQATGCKRSIPSPTCCL